MSETEDNKVAPRKVARDTSNAGDKTIVRVAAPPPTPWSSTTPTIEPMGQTNELETEGHIVDNETKGPADVAITSSGIKSQSLQEHQESWPEGTPPTETEKEDTKTQEARIEVPVQQQYVPLFTELSKRIQDHPGGHDLLAVLRMLEGQTAPIASHGPDGETDKQTPPRIGKSRRLIEDIVRFGQDPSSEFATSTVERAMRDKKDGLVLLERFLGLLGPQGALPAAMTDEAIMRGLRGDDSFPRFLDVFNNRFVQLFYRAWADARPIVQHDRPDDDRFMDYVGSSIGTGSPIYRDLDLIDDRLKLLYAGLISAKAKSASRLKALITGVFEVKVEIDQCIGTWLHLEPDDQLSLGSLGPGGAGQLGLDTIVGAKVYSVSDKIRIRIFTRSLEEYRKFLPPTRTKPNPRTERLFDLIEFYLGLEIEYEIELALPKRCASAINLNSSNSATLGHIGWLKPATDASQQDAETEDEEMLTDTRFRPLRRHTTVYQ
ncbi:type VI secretion system baseplate subunit TssG [Roseibium sp. SCP14]|uniref:type VI secretion system baseplate subunit TssG n=1 Tax=Roseibium sp. SCP14 TaxID=3141375 RepID=UPI00333B4C8E